jgi:hypothetical protein
MQRRYCSLVKLILSGGDEEDQVDADGNQFLQERESILYLLVQ